MTNTALMFDTLQYAKKLQKVGVPEAQAEIQAEALKEQNKAINGWVDDNLVTKRDMKELEISLKRDMKELEISLKRDMKELGLRLENKLLIKLGSMIVGVAGIMLAILIPLILRH